MKTKHKHAKEIKAWADGATIQYEDVCDGQWYNVPFPEWGTLTRYRIKPETVKYRVALFKGFAGHPPYPILSIDGVHDPLCVTSHSSFIRWLGDSQVVEV